MSSFNGKVALVTGGTSGIGRETAVELARRGAHVVLTGRRKEEGEAVARDASRLGAKALFVRGDVTDEGHIAEAVRTALSITGRLDFAFNNAGIELGGVATTEATAEQYRKVFDVNVLGVLLSMKHEMRAMGEHGGSIVNNASIAGRIGMPGVGIYIASKHAVLGLTKAAALEGAPRKIRVNSVSPGAVVTEMFERFTGGGQPDTVQHFASLHPLGRLGTVSEIAKVAVFLLSDDASFITGQDLAVDGGFTVP